MSDPEAPAGVTVWRKYAIPLVAIGATVLVIGAVLIAVVIGGAGGASAGDDAHMTSTPTANASTAQPTQTATTSPTATAAPTPTTEPAPPTGPIARIPSDCSGLYSEGMWALLTGAASELNPPDYKTVAERITSPEVAAVLAGLPPGLTCHWRVNLHSGIGTDVVPIDPVLAADVESMLAASGYTAIAEPWGTRWVIEFTEEYTWGESHTMVGGVWFATAWLEIAPDGYTADMVSTIVF